LLRRLSRSNQQFMSFGQVVIGPPGSGKTVYCHGMQQFLQQLNRKVLVVNLDFANENLPYKCGVNVKELVTLDDVMKQYQLGPNGGLMFCMEYLEKNLDWLEDKLKAFEDHYILFDCPGQVELYTHHSSMRNIVQALTKTTYRLTAVHLIDSYYCSSCTNYISAVLLSLSTMLQIELPHINVLSKIDLIEKYGKLDFNLEYYTNVMDLTYLQKHLEKESFSEKYRALNKALCEVIEDFYLVSFYTLNIQDKENVLHLVKAIDKSNGYCFGSLDSVDDNTLHAIATPDVDFEYNRVAAVHEKYIASDVDNDLKEYSEELQQNKNN